MAWHSRALTALAKRVQVLALERTRQLTVILTLIPRNFDTGHTQCTSLQTNTRTCKTTHDCPNPSRERKTPTNMSDRKETNSGGLGTTQRTRGSRVKKKERSLSNRRSSAQQSTLKKIHACNIWNKHRQKLGQELKEGRSLATGMEAEAMKRMLLTGSLFLVY